jgi:hypothetical protein
MNAQYISAQTALDNQDKNGSGFPVTETAKFTCPYNDCRTFAVQHWGEPGTVKIRHNSSMISNRHFGKIPAIVFSLCEACGREAVYIGGRIVLPGETDAPPPAIDLPGDCVSDYEEARAILPQSPRGTAALLRLVIQKLLPHLGATKKTIDGSIGELGSGPINRIPLAARM